MVNILIDCNNCAHCVDLHTPSEDDSPPLKIARSKILKTITKWLTPTQEEIEKVNNERSNQASIQFLE